MAHYAFLDENNIVTEVIVGIDETETIQGLSLNKPLVGTYALVYINFISSY